MLIEEVSLPPLPPTFNTLTAVERAHLRRSTNKLGRILGITPLVLDLESDNTMDDEAYTESRHRWSSSTGIVASNTMRHPGLSLSCVDFHEHLINNAHLMPSGEPKRGLNYTSMHYPPLLRVSRSTHFHSVPKLNTLNLSSYNLHESPVSDDDSLPDLYSDTSSESDCSEPPSPTITPLSINALRRKKMERLQRIFGEDVPVDMVFPDTRSNESGFESDGPSPLIMKRPKSAPAGSFRFQFSPFGEQKLRRPATTDGMPSLTEERRSRFRKGQEPASTSQAASPQERRKRPSTPHPHYRLQSSLRDENLTQPAASAKYSYIYYPNQFSSSNGHLPMNDERATQPAEYGDARSLRMVVESPEEIESVLASRASSLFPESAIQKTTSRTQGSDRPSNPEWHLGNPDEHAPDVAVTTLTPDDKFQMGRQEVIKTVETKRIWSHRRKPPPVYEP